MVVLGVTLLLTACARGAARTATSTPSGVSPSAYVAGVCGAVLSWEQSIKSRTDALPSQLASVTSLADGRQVFTDYLDGTVQETNAMIDKVQRLRSPLVSNGREVQATVVKALQTIRSTLVDAESKARDLPTDNVAAFQRGAEEIGLSVESELSGLDSKLGVADSPDLSMAAASDPSCKQLSSL